MGRLLWVTGLSIAGYIVWPYLFRIPVPDESIHIYAGLRLANGELPYRDFFDHVYPGVFYWIALLIKLCGGLSLVVLRLSALAVFTVCAYVTLYISKKYLSGGWLVLLGGSLWCALYPSWATVQHHIFSSMFGLLAVLAMYQLAAIPCSREKDFLKSRRSFLIGSGMLLGFTVLFTQSLGVILSLLMGGWLWFYWIKTCPGLFINKVWTLLGWFVLPGVSLLGVLYGYYWSQGGLDAFWYDTVTWVLSGHYTGTTHSVYFFDGLQMLSNKWFVLSQKPLENPLVWLDSLYLVLQGMLPVAGLCWLTWQALWPALQSLSKNEHSSLRTPQSQWQLLLLWVAAVGFMAANFSYPTSYMIGYHGWILYMGGFWLLKHLCQPWQWARRAVMVGLSLILGVTLMHQIEVATAMMKVPPVISYGTRERWLIPKYPELSAFLNPLVETIHQHTQQGSSFFVYNLMPALYLLTDRHNPTRYSYVIAKYNTDSQIQELTQQVGRTLPQFIVNNHLDDLFFRIDPRFSRWRHQDYKLKGLEQVIQSHYHQIAGFEHYDVFMRNPSSTEGGGSMRMEN